MSESHARDDVPIHELQWTDGPSSLLHLLLSAAASVASARSLPDLCEGICRALAGHGLPSLVLAYRPEGNTCQVLAHRLGSVPPLRPRDLTGIAGLLAGPALLGPNRHPLARLLPNEDMLGLPSLSAPFSLGEGDRTGIISLFAVHLVSTDTAAVEALAALLGSAAGRIQANQRLHEVTARLEGRVRSRADEPGMLYELASVLCNANDERSAVELAVQAAARVAGGDGVAALVCLERRHTAVLAARGAIAPALHTSISARLAALLETRAGADHRQCISEPMLVLAADDRRPGLALDGPLAATADTPVIAGGRVSGILACLHTRPPAGPHEPGQMLGAIAGLLGTTVERLASARGAERQRLAALIEGLPDGVVVLSAELNVLTGNQTGRERLAALGGAEHGGAAPAAVAALAARTLALGDAETAVLTAPGDRPRTITVTAHRVADVTGEPAVVLSLHDTTEASLMRERLFQSEKMASVGQLVSGVAHELNNPLTGIMGFAQLLLARGLDPTAEQRVATIFGEAERASKIVQNLLSFARRRRPEKVDVDLHLLIERVVALREYELKVNDIDLRRHFDPALPHCFADPHQLQQVLLNVLTNAEHAVRTRERPRRITVSTGTTAHFVRLTVEDTGPGIPPEHLRRVFDPFFTTKPVGEGTGLGLTISYGIIEEHGGRIDLESRPGAGVTVTILLPVATADVPHTPAPHSASATVFRPHAILVVDDEHAIQDLLTGILTMDGHLVETARTGAEALERLAARRFDAIITDIRMPEMDGISFYRQMQASDPELARRIIFTSGDTVNRETRAFIQSTDIPFLPKPFKIGAVRELVDAVLSGSD